MAEESEVKTRTLLRAEGCGTPQIPRRFAEGSATRLVLYCPVTSLIRSWLSF